MVKMFKNISLNTKILGTILAFFTLSQILISGIFYSETKKMQNLITNSITAQTESNISKITESNAKLSEEFLEKISRLTFTLKNSIEYITANMPRETIDNTGVSTDFEYFFVYDPSSSSKNISINFHKYIFPTSKQIYDFDTAILSVYFALENGYYYEYSSKQKGIFDPKNRSWYTDAKAQFENHHNIDNTAIWQDIYNDINSNAPCITCSLPILDSNNEFIGAAAIDIQLEKIQNNLSNNQILKNSDSFILDKNNKIIMNDHEKTANLDKNYISNLNLANQKNKNLIVNFGKNDYIISSVPIVNTSWTFGVIVPKDEILKPVKDTETNIFEMMTKFLITFLICTSIISILCFFATKKILRPIKKVRKNLDKIGNGDLDIILPVETNDEFGKLCAAFNNMTKNLKKYIDNLAKTTAEKEKIRQELSIAKKIQHSMLPYTFPAFPERNDFDIFAIMEPAREVGGDFYDFFFIDENNLAIVAADVSDKGVSAALFMVITKILLKNQAISGTSPAEILQSLNDKLCETNDAGMFVTIFLGILNLKTGKFTFANAGHNPPYIYKNSNKKFLNFPAKKTFVLAAKTGIVLQNQEIFLDKNDIIYIYTDGVTEAENPDGKLFSQSKLTSFLNEKIDPNACTAKQIIEKTYHEIIDFENGAHQSDDITMLCVKINKNFTNPKIVEKS